jgi:hypothetical protein
MAAFGGAAWPHLGIGAAALRGLPDAPHRGQRHAPNREGQVAAMKWVRINEIWYYTVDEWNEVVRIARQRRTNPTADYLLGTPMLGDYLEEGLIQLGLTVEDLEPAWR